MTAQNIASLTLQDAHQFLKRFDCVKGNAMPPIEELEQIRQALLLMTKHSDYQILGVCADSAEQGAIALQEYANALGYQPNFAAVALEGPAYLKFNPKSSRCHVDAYLGEHRGVLVSCQSADSDGVNEMYGHLPLSLFHNN